MGEKNVSVNAEKRKKPSSAEVSLEFSNRYDIRASFLKKIGNELTDSKVMTVPMSRG